MRTLETAGSSCEFTFMIEQTGSLTGHSDFACQDSNGFRHFDMSAPGTPNLVDTNPGANDQISSYICFA